MYDPLRDDATDCDRIDRDRWMFERHRALCLRHPVAPGGVRTTPPSAVDVTALFPELADHRRTAVRLHPRFGPEPPADASKLGGTFLWPHEAPWPTCPEHGIPHAAILQLRAEELPEIAFRPGSDLMQLTWCPRDHDEWVSPLLTWRRRDAVTFALDPVPVSPRAFLEYVPLPCLLMPERFVEFPSLDNFHDLEIHEPPPDSPAGRALAQWRHDRGAPNGPFANAEDICELYDEEWSQCEGTKVGGYPVRTDIPTCRCGREMEHLAHITSTEWGGQVSRWCPLEDRGHAEVGDWEKLEVAREPLGVNLGDNGSISIFLCRTCPDWPIRHVISA